MAKKKEIEEQTFIDPLGEPVELTETITTVEEISATKPYIKPGFIIVKQKSGIGGEIIIRETQLGKAFSTDEWEQITDSKKK